MESSAQPSTAMSDNDNTAGSKSPAALDHNVSTTSQQNQQIKTSSSYDIKGESTDDDATMNDTTTAVADVKVDNSHSMHHVGMAAAVSAPTWPATQGGM